MIIAKNILEAYGRGFGLDGCRPPADAFREILGDGAIARLSDPENPEGDTEPYAHMLTVMPDTSPVQIRPLGLRDFALGNSDYSADPFIMGATLPGTMVPYPTITEISPADLFADYGREMGPGGYRALMQGPVFELPEYAGKNEVGIMPQPEDLFTGWFPVFNNF